MRKKGDRNAYWFLGIACLLCLAMFLLTSCGDAPDQVTGADLAADSECDELYPDRSGPRFDIHWEGLAQIDSAYIAEAFADVQDSVNAWFAPATNDAIAVRVSTADLNHHYGHHPHYAAMVERGKGLALNNHLRALLDGVIAEGGERYLDVRDGNPVIYGAEIVIDERQMAAETSRAVWRWVLLHEMIHVMGFGTSMRFHELAQKGADGTPVSILGHDLDDPFTGHWRQTGGGRLLEPYFPGVARAFVARETLAVLEAIGWPRR